MIDDKNFMKLSSEVRRTVIRQWESYQKASPCNLHPSTGNFTSSKLILPKSRRHLRALGIACWYLPDKIKWEIILQMSEKPFSLDFLNKGLEISLELRCLVESEEQMISYLFYFINPRELFGTILQEDLKEALEALVIKEEQKGPVRRPIRRKGYKDKGSWRLPHCWMEKFDLSFTEQQNQKEFKSRIYQLFTIIFLRKLERKGK
jgi:hypothetical protein